VPIASYSAVKIEQVESEIGLRHEPVPFGESNFGVAGCEPGAKVVFQVWMARSAALR
jgi:hypothetical protein